MCTHRHFHSLPTSARRHLLSGHITTRPQSSSAVTCGATDALVILSAEPHPREEEVTGPPRVRPGAGSCGRGTCPRTPGKMSCGVSSQPPERSGEGGPPSDPSIAGGSADGMSGGWNGVLSIFLITRSDCAFVNYTTEGVLQAAIARFDGVSLRSEDPRCHILVCRVRGTEQDLRAGVGGQRGMGLHKQWGQGPGTDAAKKSPRTGRGRGAWPASVRARAGASPQASSSITSRSASSYSSHSRRTSSTRACAAACGPRNGTMRTSSTARSAPHRMSSSS
ncbi:hypothetical protein DFH07DRAFT_120897 [Mycena maculata]|uniref:YTH1-like RRM domain-containing protein n=1 Tax=Mycena maculata TaxID=230809 RepID=A0AAD7JY50_9AGAR|nr:hypothetical protein DFH07DRAFT_120897 [Mycena maculata]